MSEKNDIQLNLFEHIKRLLPANTSLADEIGDVLKLSTDSVYRRLRGDTQLNINEVRTLCDYYRISFDIFSNKDKSIIFNYADLKNNLGFEYYLSSILEDMKQIDRAENRQILYAAIDVPIFHHFNYPELSAFKMFYWMKAVVNVPELDEKKFSVEHIDPKFYTLGKDIYNLYSKIPSIEIWTEETVNSLIKQIEFFWDSGNFQTKEDAIKVCEQARTEMQVIKEQAEKTNKLGINRNENDGEYLLYHSDIEIGNNCIYTKRSDNDLVYLSVHTFNKIISASPEFVKDTRLWLENLVKKSTLISGVSQKNRYKFFKKIEDKIDRLYNKIDRD